MERDWDNVDGEEIYNDVRCEIASCGESIAVDKHGNFLEEVGEFAGPDGQRILAHTTCGLSLGLEMA
jgi:hypothetical protein